MLYRRNINKRLNLDYIKKFSIVMHITNLEKAILNV